MRSEDNCPESPVADADPGRWYRPTHLHVEDYNVGWPAAYDAERAALAAVVGSRLVAIEHVGSTAVPGMAAKPIIDILVAVSSWDDRFRLIDDLATVGYRYTPESEADDPDRRVFRKGPVDYAKMRTHHLHVTLEGSLYWDRITGFRDWLRSHPEDAAEYARLKRELAAMYATDSFSFTLGKTGFVRTVERQCGIQMRP